MNTANPQLELFSNESFEELQKRSEKKHPVIPAKSRLPRNKILGEVKAVYHGSIMNDALLTGISKGEPFVPFDKLDENVQKLYFRLSNTQGIDDLSSVDDPKMEKKVHQLRKGAIKKTVSFYNKKGQRLELSPLQHFIIFHLQDMYCEQVKNSGDFNKENWMLSDPMGIVYCTYYSLTQRVYGVEHPSGQDVEHIKKAVNSLCCCKEGEVGYVHYWHMIVNKGKEQWTPIVMEDTPLKRGILGYEGVNEKDLPAEAQGCPISFLQLHQAFFSNLHENYILAMPVSKKLTEWARKKSENANTDEKKRFCIPKASTFGFLRMLLRQGTYSKRRKNFKLKLSTRYLLELIAPREYKYRRLEEGIAKIEEAIDAALYVGILSKVERIGEDGKADAYNLLINQDFFPSRMSQGGDETS